VVLSEIFKILRAQRLFLILNIFFIVVVIVVVLVDGGDGFCGGG